MDAASALRCSWNATCKVQTIGTMWQSLDRAKRLGVHQQVCWQAYTPHQDTPSTARDCNLPKGSRPWLGRNAPLATAARAVISTTYMQLRQLRHGSMQALRCGMWHKFRCGINSHMRHVYCICYCQSGTLPIPSQPAAQSRTKHDQHGNWGTDKFKLPGSSCMLL